MPCNIFQHQKFIRLGFSIKRMFQLRLSVSTRDFWFLLQAIKLVHFWRCLEKQNNNSNPQLSWAHWCYVLSDCTYGPDHPLSESKSHLRGHRKEVDQFSRRIIGTISICTTSCQICCWCSANNFRHGWTSLEFHFLLNTISYSKWRHGPGRRLRPQREMMAGAGGVGRRVILFSHPLDRCCCRLPLLQSASLIVVSVLIHHNRVTQSLKNTSIKYGWAPSNKKLPRRRWNIDCSAGVSVSELLICLQMSVDQTYYVK